MLLFRIKPEHLTPKSGDPNNAGIADFDAMDYIEVYGDITSFNGALQVNVKRVRRCEEGEYDEQEYMPVSSRNLDEMYAELLALIDSIENTYLKTLLQKVLCGGSSICAAVSQGFGGKDGASWIYRRPA